MKYHLKLKSIKYRKSKYQIDKANNIYNRSLIQHKIRSRRSSKYSNTRQITVLNGKSYTATKNTLKRVINPFDLDTNQKSQINEFDSSKIILGDKVYQKSSKTGRFECDSNIVPQQIMKTIAAINLSKKKNKICLFYKKYNKCMRGDKCPFIHNKPICTKFLIGKCKNENDCKLNHNITPNIIPHCIYYLQNKCNNENCPYYHVKLSYNTPICQLFVQGKCEKCDKCKFLHCYPTTNTYHFFSLCLWLIYLNLIVILQNLLNYQNYLGNQ